MIGPICLFLSWLLLRFEGKGLGVLGFNAARVRAGQFLVGLLVAGAVVALQQVAMSGASGVGWKLNPQMDAAGFLNGLRLNVNSVLYEEFLFRGYLLYQAIRWLGARWGVLVGAAAFGVYHWFSYGVVGNPVVMVYVFGLTGSFGLAFAKTKSMAAPIGLHLGWNLVTNLGFSGGPFGAGVFVTSSGAPNQEVPGMLGLVLSLGLPVGFAFLTCWYLLRGGVSDGSDSAGAVDEANAA